MRLVSSLLLGLCFLPLHRAEEPPASPPAEAAAPAPASAPLTSVLQGNEGARIQTMCTNCNTASLDLCGLGEESLAIERDGFPVTGGLQTVAVFSLTPPALQSGVAVEKGPGDHRAPGEAVGGVIRIDPAPPDSRPRVQASGEAGSFSWGAVQASASFDVRGLSGTGLYLRNRSDPIDADGDGFNESGDLSREFVAAEAGYRTDRGLRVTGGAARIREDDPDGRGKYSLLESLRQGRPAFLPEDAFLDFDRLHLGLDAPVGGGGTLRLRAERSVRDQDIFSPVSFVDEPRRPRYFIEDRHATAAVRYEHLVGDRLLLSGGLIRRRQVLEVENFEAVFEALQEMTDRFENSGADAGFAADLSSRWHLRAGARYDLWKTAHAEGRLAEPGGTITRRSSWSSFSPRARLIWKPASAWTVTLAAGRGARAARPVFSKVCCGQRYQSNIDVALERAVAGSVDLVWQPDPRVRIGAYLHRTVFRDHIVRMVGTSQLGVQTYVQGNVPRARYTGLVLTSRLRPAEPLGLDLAWSWLEARNVSGEPAVAFFTPPDRSRIARHDIPMDRIPYRPVRSGSAALRWSAPRGLVELALTGQYQGPMLIQQWHRGIRNVRPSPQLGLRYDYRSTPSFWTVNARVAWRPRQWLAVHAGVDNIGDEVQGDLADPTTDFNWGPIRGRYAYGGVTFTL